MFIRRTAIKSRKSGTGSYFTHRLVETERVDGKVKQHILLNLGRYFCVPKNQWKDLAARIKQLLDSQSSLVIVELPIELEIHAQHYAEQIIASRSIETADVGQFYAVNLDSMELSRPRRVGVEQLALHAMKQLKLQQKFRELGFNSHQIAAALGNIVARMAHPASERESHRWLQQVSGLGELIDYDFEAMEPGRLYQASDRLYQHREALEAHLYSQEQSLFSFEETVTLYDLTNTFFEGTAAANPKAKLGRSKEKRNDCPLVTLGLVLDGSGFPRKSRIFTGNVSEGDTLEAMLTGLGVARGAIVVMDAGIASEENISWLKEHHYRYLWSSADNANGISMKMQQLPSSKQPGSRFRYNALPTMKPGRLNSIATLKCARKKNRPSRTASPSVLNKPYKAWRMAYTKKADSNTTKRCWCASAA
jgi:hypothetical protein